jgi:hypothetical protein
MTKKSERRVRTLLKRALKEKQLGNKHHERGRAALVKARQCGLELNTPIEMDVAGEDGSIQKVSYEVVDNFTGEAAYRSTCIPRFELKKVPKFRRESATPAPARNHAPARSETAEASL